MKRRIAKKIVSGLAGRRLKWRRRTMYRAADMILGSMLSAEDIDDIIRGHSQYINKGFVKVSDGAGRSITVKIKHATISQPRRVRIAPILQEPYEVM